MQTPSSPATKSPESGSTPATKDWAAENAAANARANARKPTAAGGLVRHPMNIPTKKAEITDAQITAECQANRGVRCTSKGEINKRRFEQHTESTMSRQR